MVQAARSGKQDIIEGSEDGQTGSEWRLFQFDYLVQIGGIAGRSLVVLYAVFEGCGLASRVIMMV